MWVRKLEYVLSTLQTSEMSPAPEPERRPFFRRPMPRKIDELEDTSERDQDEYEYTEDEILALLRDTFFRKKKNADNKSDTHVQTKTSSNARPSQKLADCICFNCHEKGHLFRDCKKPRRGIFCHLCGADDKKTFDCDCSKNEAACLDRETEASESASGSQNQ